MMVREGSNSTICIIQVFHRAGAGRNWDIFINCADCAMLLILDVFFFVIKINHSPKKLVFFHERDNTTRDDIKSIGIFSSLILYHFNDKI